MKCEHRTGDGMATEADKIYTPGSVCPHCQCTLGADGFWYVEAEQAIDTSKPVLYRHSDGAEIRNATNAELRASIDAADSDGGVGIIEVDGIDCFVRE